MLKLENQLYYNCHTKLQFYHFLISSLVSPKSITSLNLEQQPTNQVPTLCSLLPLCSQLPLIKAESTPQGENRDTTAYRGDFSLQSRAISEITRTPPANEGWISHVLDPYQDAILSETRTFQQDKNRILYVIAFHPTISTMSCLLKKRNLFLISYLFILKGHESSIQKSGSFRHVTDTENVYVDSCANKRKR